MQIRSSCVLGRVRSFNIKCSTCIRYTCISTISAHMMPREAHLYNNACGVIGSPQYSMTQEDGHAEAMQRHAARTRARARAHSVVGAQPRERHRAAAHPRAGGGFRRDVDRFKGRPLSLRPAAAYRRHSPVVRARALGSGSCRVRVRVRVGLG